MPERPSGSPVCRVIAGPNGAGKTTFALSYLPQVAPGSGFVNADLIAAGLSPLAPEQRLVAASRLFLRQVREHAAERRDFAFETTLAGRGYLRLIQQIRADGWRVELLYLALPTVELSRQRVAERVDTADTPSRTPTSPAGSRAVCTTCSTTTPTPSITPCASSIPRRRPRWSSPNGMAVVVSSTSHSMMSW